MTKTFFVFGAGYSGRAFAAARIGTERLYGTTRSPEKSAALVALGMEPHLFNGELTPAITAALHETTHLIVSIAPGDDGDPVLQATRDIIAHQMPALCWIGYLSTVGVYGDHHGEWVNESSACRPVSRRSVLRVEAESAWLAFGAEIDVPVAILRLSGIYGPGRNALVNLANGTARRLVKQGQVFNRIHVEDIAGSLWRLANADKGGVFNITDDEPAPPQDVVSYAAGLMEVAAPPEIPFETAQLSPMARSFYGENKRVSNAAIKAEGYRFRYRDYRAAFDAMWADGTWKGAGEDDAASPMRAG